MSKRIPIPSLALLGDKNAITLIQGAQQEAQRVLHLLHQSYDEQAAPRD